MYIPAHFEQPDVGIMHELISAYPLATVVTLSPSGLNANHIPLHLTADVSTFGVLTGHVARANPVWQDYVPESEILAVFQAPNAYISPSWYATKPETGKVVPTWNYAAVHVYGTLRVINDAAWLRDQLEMLTADREAVFAEPWKVADAPVDFTDKLLEAIVGIEITINRLEGKWKVSQNQPLRNQASVMQGLTENGQQAMAELVARFASEKSS
ncbi:MAG: FMN-binding negative transcriptional regulator [Methylobacter sp.]